MGSVLYLVSEKYGYALKMVYESADSALSLCLLQDGVYLACRGKDESHLNKISEKGVKIYAIEKDVNLRGIHDLLSPNVKLISYEEFIDLIFSNEKVISL